MSTNVTGGSFKTATDTPNRGTTNDLGDRIARNQHSRIHPRPEHGCPLCPPVPCWCGYDGPGVCPTVSDCRLREVSPETAWRAVA